MCDKKEKIRRLYENGILIKGEMEAELQKIEQQTPSKTGGKKWILIVAVAAVVIISAIIVIISLGKPCETPTTSEIPDEIVASTPDNSETVISQMDGSVVPVETAHWTVTSVDGVPAIQTKFTNDKNGTIEVTYIKDKGFRFGWFDNKGVPKTLTTIGGFNYPVIFTQEMLDKMKETDQETARLYIDQVGKEQMNPLSASEREGNYLYYYNEDVVTRLINGIDDGSMTWFELFQFIENGNDVSATDYVGEYKYYIWGTKFIPGEFSKAKDDI